MAYQDYNELMSHLFEGVYVVDPNRKILFWNSGSEHITGFTAEEVISSHCFDNILEHVDQDGHSLCFNGCPMHRTLQTGEILDANVFLRHKNGHRVPVSIRTIPIYDDNDRVIAAIEVFSDTRYRNDLLEENRRLQQLATIDQLTNVYNRQYMEYQLHSLLEESKEFDSSFGLLFVDIDHFKNINDTFGHNVGDVALQLVTRTIESNLRNGDMIGRWGGEEFVVVLRYVNQESLFAVAEKLRALISKSRFTHDNIDFSITVSIGATLYRQNETLDSLVKRSDQLMYTAKQQGRNRTMIDQSEEM